MIVAYKAGSGTDNIARVLADFASFPSEVKVLGVFNPERLPEYPEVPTLKELGLYDQWLGSSRCIAGPAGLPAEAVTFYAEAFEKLMQDPDYLKAAEAAGINTAYQGPEATGKMVADQQAFAEGLDAVWGG